MSLLFLWTMQRKPYKQEEHQYRLPTFLSPVGVVGMQYNKGHHVQYSHIYTSHLQPYGFYLHRVLNSRGCRRVPTFPCGTLSQLNHAYTSSLPPRGTTFLTLPQLSFGRLGGVRESQCI